MRILSGGQTGVDRAALDVALDLGLNIGGWCPRGRRAEDGRIPDKYPLVEMTTSEYEPRTRKNVVAADATLVIHRGAMTPGSALTLRIAREVTRPNFAVDLEHYTSVTAEHVRAWLKARLIVLTVGAKTEFVLNVAGSRESSAPGIYEEASVFLRALLAGMT